jgi:enamine deaminase RidA (YjgF/YER057c/UK114 family)
MRIYRYWHKKNRNHKNSKFCPILSSFLLGRVFMMSKITTRNTFAHIRVVADFIFVSGTISRIADNTIARVDVIDELCTKFLNIETQIRVVFKNIDKNLQTVGASIKDVVAAIFFLATRRASYINGINILIDGGRIKSL